MFARFWHADGGFPSALYYGVQVVDFPVHCKCNVQVVDFPVHCTVMCRWWISQCIVLSCADGGFPSALYCNVQVVDFPVIIIIIIISTFINSARVTQCHNGAGWRQCIVLSCAGGGFPNAKLAALQKVLSSEFFTAVREVYEHVYETVDLSGSVEVRANATAKVCV